MPRTRGVDWGTKASGGNSEIAFWISDFGFWIAANQAALTSVSCWCSKTLYALCVEARVGWCVPAWADAPLPEEPVLASTKTRQGVIPRAKAGPVPSRMAVAKQPGQAIRRAA